MDNERLDRLFDFIREIDKEKFVKRQTLLTDGETRENDAEHAWHLAVMALLLGEYANERIDLLKVISMLLIHDIVEIDAGDTYAYDEEAKATEAERESAAADRLFGLLPDDKRDEFRALFDEFCEGQTAEASFARSLDNVQPAMLNAATGGKAWVEHDVDFSQILTRNSNTPRGSLALWNYQYQTMIKPYLENGVIKP